MNNLGNPYRSLKPLACGLAAALLGACASAPSEPVSEKLDPDTATTVTILSHPIELLSQNRSKQMDPFAYIAPFETNRMGARDLFLWISTPQAQGQLTQPQVLCDGQPLSLQPLSQDSGAAGARAAGPGDNVAPAGAPDAVVRRRGEQVAGQSRHAGHRQRHGG